MEPTKSGLERILAERAERLGLSVEEVLRTAPQTPRYLAGAAEKEGKTVDEVLRDDVLRLDRSRYPTEDCLEPHEVEQCIKGELGSLRTQHLESCLSCQSLIAACKPSDARIQEFAEEIRRLSISALQQRDSAGLRSLLHRLER